MKTEGATPIAWEIEAVGGSCHLIVTHDQLREGANEQLYGGWPMILSGLKQWLETGEWLTTLGSRMYGRDIGRATYERAAIAAIHPGQALERAAAGRSPGRSRPTR